jgi:hypothetical protein
MILIIGLLLGPFNLVLSSSNSWSGTVTSGAKIRWILIIVVADSFLLVVFPASRFASAVTISSRGYGFF